MRALLEESLDQSLGSAESPSPAPAPAQETGTRVGEILDTHNPHLAGRILVRWRPTAEQPEQQWLRYLGQLTLRRGDRVLLTQPIGWPEWLVMGALSHSPSSTPRLVSSAPAPAPAEPAAPLPAATDSELRLEPGSSLRIVTHEGVHLLTVRSDGECPIVELPGEDVELRATRRLRLKADSVEIEAGGGGVDVRTTGDSVLRARTIRLN